MSKARDAIRSAHLRTAFYEGSVAAEDAKAQAYMRRAVTQLMARHNLTEREAASLMLTVTEVVSLGPKSAR